MEELCLLGMLGICSMEDYRHQRLQIIVLWAFGIVGIILHMWRHTFSLALMAGGMAVGGMLVLASVLSGGKIGIGDGIVLTISGIYLGLWNNLWLLMLSSFLLAAAAAGVWITKQKDKKDELPFVPFVFFAYLLYLWIKGGTGG
jgi:prepilin signal peptidase PulO-like enzyme (type II secretory pathway)